MLHYTRELVKTEDGSNTLMVKEINEHYHSVHGALQESAHVFIQSGFEFIAKQLKQINILEVGFGTGLNALLTLKTSEKTIVKVNYVAIEPYLLDSSITKQLKYTEIIGPQYHEAFYTMHHNSVFSPRYISEQFIFMLIHEKLENITLQQQQFQLIYFDAFSPQVQPELWDTEIFNKLYQALSAGGVLVTYSAKGSVKRNLKEAGFVVENLAGPIGKREITRAIKL